MYTVTEKARSEFIVAPILVECRQRLQHRINVFSGVTLDAEPKGLANEISSWHAIFRNLSLKHR
jgi:hypothetical protein